MGTRILDLKGFFERLNWQKLAVLYFQIGKKVQQKGLKLKKLLGSFMTRILRFSFIYAWYFDLCASVKMMKRNNKLGVFELFPVRNWIKKSGRGGSKSGRWVFVFTFSRIFICKKSVKTSEICFASFCRQVSESGRNTWEFHPLTSLLLRCRIHHSN